jgi:hypothetical protein
VNNKKYFIIPSILCCFSLIEGFVFRVFESSRWLCVLLCLCVSVVNLAFAACKGDPKFDRSSVIRFESRTIQPQYFHHLSTEQIEAMRNVRLQGSHMHNPGITKAEHELVTNAQIGGNQYGRGNMCVWADSVEVRFGFTKMDVFLSSRYPEGGCAYQVVLGHENEHVAINNRIMAKYRILMERALRTNKTIPTKANPLAVRSMQQGRTAITQSINRIVKPLYAQFQKEVQAANDRIDTTVNYRRTQAKCKDW